MAFNLSITSFVIAAISITVIIIGVFYLADISLKSKEIAKTEFPSPFQDGASSQSARVNVEVTPTASVQGTTFAITASIWPRSQYQNLNLVLQDNQGNEIGIVLYDDGQHQDGVANDGVYGGLFDSQNFALGTYKIISSEGVELSQFALEESRCLPLAGSPAYEKINFVILPYGYDDIEDFKKDARNLLIGRGAFSDVEPFKSSFDDFSFSFVEPLVDLKCEVGCKGVETMVCCDDKKVSESASQCHHDGVIVLINSDNACGTASFYAKICAKADLASQILLHELGHSFGNLADEYVYADYFKYNIPEGKVLEMPNCDVEGCPKWADITDGCYLGCTSPNLYRSSQNSIMRYVSFGRFNEVGERALVDEIQSRIKLESEVHKNNPQWKSFYVNLEYQNKEFMLGPATTRPVKPGVLSSSGNFQARLKDENDEIIFTSRVDFPFILYPAMEISESPIVYEETSFPVVLPFDPRAKSFEIVRDETVLASGSLAAFTDLCGDGVCQKSENHIKCPRDCGIENDNFCESIQCDPDCANYEQCLSSTQKRSYVVPVIFIIISLIIITIILFKSKNKI